MPIYNAAFLLPLELDPIFEKISQDLAVVTESSYILGVNSMVHVPLVQFEYEVHMIPVLWRNFPPETLTTRFPMMIGDFYIQETGDSVWYGISIEPSPEMMELQESFVSAVKPARILNAYGDKYFPHITLGKSNLVAKRPSFVVPESLRKLDLSGVLRLGLSGPDLQFSRQIY